MNLLQVSMAVHDLPLPHLIAILLCFIIALAFVFINGINLKLGEKEVSIGGLKRLFDKRDADTALKELLKKQIDGIDADMEADILDLADSIHTRLEGIALKEHCWFTLEEFTDIIRDILYRHIRRNNLKTKLALVNRDEYVNKIVEEVRQRYGVFQLRTSKTHCRDEFGEFTLIEAQVLAELSAFFDKTVAIITARLKEKLSLYEKSLPDFKTKEGRRSSCEIPMQKNRDYIAKLLRRRYEDHNLGSG